MVLPTRPLLTFSLAIFLGVLGWVVFKEKLEAALERGEGVCDVVADCYGSIRYGFERAASAEEGTYLASQLRVEHFLRTLKSRVFEWKRVFSPS